MENMVTLSLEDYTKLIIELENAKRTLATYKKNILKGVRELINDSKIYDQNNKDELFKDLSLDEEGLLRKYTSNYSWRYSSIAEENSYIMSVEEVKYSCAEIIRQMINEKIKDIIDSEKGE